MPRTGLTAQDAHVAGYALEEGIGLVVAINKWDIVEDKTQSTFDEYVADLRREAPFLAFAPIVSISAKTGQRVERVLEAALEIAAERRRRVPTAALNAWLRDVTAAPAAVIRRAASSRASSTRRRSRSSRRRSCSSPTARS